MHRTHLCLATSSRYGLSREEQIALFGDRGFDGFFVNWHRGESLLGCRKAAQEHHMLFQSVHAPFGHAADFWEGDEELGRISVEEQLQCLRACADAQVPLVIVHAYKGFENHTPNQVGVDRFARVVEEAEKLGVRIAFENTEGEEYLAALMDAFQGNPYVGFCWDTGHELCYNGGKDMMSLYGDRILGTHINDNLGVRDFEGRVTWLDDLHLMPFDGISDWESVAQRLAKWGMTETLTFELTTKSKPGRYDNDKYAKMPLEDYVTEAYARACRVMALVQKYMKK